MNTGQLGEEGTELQHLPWSPENGHGDLHTHIQLTPPKGRPRGPGQGSLPQEPQLWECSSPVVNHVELCFYLCSLTRLLTVQH